MVKQFSMELAGRTLTVEIGKVAAQANGAALMRYGDTVVLSTATASEKPREGIDFFPLSVEFEEKMYAVGKIPGGFNKREGKASEHAVLTSRVIDRPMRPLFPKDYRNDVTLNNLVMAVDPDCSPEVTAMLGASVATSISDIPFDGPIAGTRIGLIDGEFIVNPTADQQLVSDLALTVASTAEKVIMIEASIMITFSAVEATVSARSETNCWSAVGFTINSPSIRPILVPAIGPSNGISEIDVATEAPSIAVTSGEQSGSTAITKLFRVTSFL